MHSPESYPIVFTQLPSIHTDGDNNLLALANALEHRGSLRGKERDMQ
jgi:hypothetical protein